MSQINIHLTPAFEKELQKLMRVRGIKTKSDAIRIAIHECLQRSVLQRKPTHFDHWLGMGLQAPANKKTKFKSDDDLWG